MDMRVWWEDEEKETAHVADLIIAAMNADEEWDEFERFNEEYVAVPVISHAGTWYASDLSGNELWDTGVSIADVKDAETIGDLASQLNLEPWSLAADYGWPSRSFPVKQYRDIPRVRRAIDAHEKRQKREQQEAAEMARQEREDVELMDREVREERAAERGEELFYAPEGTTRAKAAELLDMPEDSKTVDQYVRRAIDIATALRRAQKIRHRHEETIYDQLLGMGISKEFARGIIEDV